MHIWRIQSENGRNKGHASSQLFSRSFESWGQKGVLKYFQIFAVVLENFFTTYKHVIESTLIHFSPSQAQVHSTWQEY